jgi:hypothetical protein
VKNSKVIAVCLDEFDINIFRENLNQGLEGELDIISPKNMRYSFYPERTLMSEQVIKNIELYSHINLNITEYGLKSFEDSVNENLLNALELACCFVQKDDLNILNSISKWALKESDELYDIIARAGFSFTENKFIQHNLSETNKIFLTKSVRRILSRVDSLSTKINVAKQLLNDDDEQSIEIELNKIIKEIQNDPHCTDELRKNLKVPLDIDFRSRYSHVKLCLEKYGIENDKNEKFFHTKMLHLVLINKKKYVIPDILKNYLNRIILDENIFPSAKTKIFKSLEEKRYNQLVIDISMYSYGVKYFILHEGTL